MSEARTDRRGHCEPITVRWGDMDIMGHVNNAKYFTYCESARMSYFAAIRMLEHREDDKHGPALAAAHLNFRRQVHHPAELDVWTRVSEIGRSSFRMEYEIVRRDGSEEGERVADGHGIIVWVDYGTGRSTPIPDALRAAIQEYEAFTGS